MNSRESQEPGNEAAFARRRGPRCEREWGCSTINRKKRKEKKRCCCCCCSLSVFRFFSLSPHQRLYRLSPWRGGAGASLASSSSSSREESAPGAASAREGKREREKLKVCCIGFTRESLVCRRPTSPTSTRVFSLSLSFSLCLRTTYPQSSWRTRTPRPS